VTRTGPENIGASYEACINPTPSERYLCLVGSVYLALGLTGNLAKDTVLMSGQSSFARRAGEPHERPVPGASRSAGHETMRRSVAFG
jgi:hypothetical protein